MNFNDLRNSIQQVSDSMRRSAILSVNTHLTVRNWLIGFYIVEFEQRGEDRAKYGAKLLQKLADAFNEEGLSYRNLRLYRQFYLVYPQISMYIPNFLQKNLAEIWQSPVAKLKSSEKEGAGIRQSLSAQFKTEGILEQLPYIAELVSKLSFTHLSLLVSIEDPLKRRFYELECIKGTWSVRELKRQIDTLYFERSGISRKPDVLGNETERIGEKASLKDIIKSPFTFEFLGLKAKDVVYESDLEQALIEHLEDFLLELGDGFCFEARQKRILIGDEYFFCDLVFYHRILKCHILIELKVDSFSHEHIGQLRTYVNYYRKGMMQSDDNPPIGILLVTNKNDALVKYAVSENDRELFVSKYIVGLPDKKQLEQFINEEYAKLAI